MTVDPSATSPNFWWTISNTAMSEAQAKAAAQDIKGRFPGVDALPVDPRQALTLHMDRSTVQLLRDGLAALDTAPGDCELLGDFSDWLAQVDAEDVEYH